MKFQEYKTHLTNLLKSKDNLLDTEGEVLIDRVIRLAQKYDKELLQLLWNDEETKNKFFEQLDGISVFKERDFCFYVEERKLDNTYTNYENRIGLSTGRYKLSDIDDVVINFPYKDCILEGGQSTEEGLDTYFEYDEKKQDYTEKESKRKEIFFNQILAKNELDRLKEPKAFVNAKKYTQKGEEQIASFNRNAEGYITDNLIVKGNNLLAMYSLLEEFKGRVKLIYIDPPYNTGNDTFKYNDNFNHSTWLTFMKNRLEVAKKFLTDDGFIMISCDDSEEPYLKVLTDSIFGRENFINTIAYERSGSAGIGQGGFFVNTTEFILIYCIDKSLAYFNDVMSSSLLEASTMKRYNKVLKKEGTNVLIDSFESKSNGENVEVFKHEEYEIDIISLANFEEREDEIRGEFFEQFDKIFRTTNPQKENSFQQDLISKMGSGLYSVLYTPSRGKYKGQQVRIYYLNGEIFAWLKDSAIIDSDNSVVKQNKLTTVWSHAEIPKADLANEGGVVLKRGKKPEQLLKRLLDLATNITDIVLDFHLGSGTTSAVAHKMGRQYIGIEQLNYGENDSVIRLNNVIQGDKSGVSKAVDWQGGGDFVYLELAKFNQEAVDAIRNAQSLEELQSYFEEMADKFFLDYNVRVHEFRTVVMHEENFKQLSLDKQKEIFSKMLDLNQLYVNVSDMEDSEYKLNDNDISLTQDFYKLNKN